MYNLQLISNSLVGGNIITIMARQLIRLKGRISAAAFRAKVSMLQMQGGEMEYQPPQVWIADIPITVKKQETYTYRSDVTQHAVESGANLSDHVILHPMRIDITFEITNFDTQKAVEGRYLLSEMWKNRESIDLETRHTILPNMIMTSFQAENSVPNWGALECRASFTQIKYVSLETVTFPEEKVTQAENTGGPDTSKSAVSEKRTGQQIPKDAGNQ